jgi:triosephosphate isomerase
MPKSVVALNLKMNRSQDPGYASKLARLYPLPDTLISPRIIVCPDHLQLERFYRDLAFSRVKLGAQNVHWEDGGAFTGEIAPGMLEGVGCAYCLVHHSERGEAIKKANLKVKALLRYGIVPVICVGEGLKVRQKGKAEQSVVRQVLGILEDLPNELVKRVLVAYEPIWAIGTGETATAEQAEAMSEAIYCAIAKKYGEKIAESVGILYGGSVSPENAADFAAQQRTRGVLVGGAALDLGKVEKIVEAFTQATKTVLHGGDSREGHN